MTFVTLIVSNVAVIISNRSWVTNFFKLLVTKNKTVKWVVGGAIFFLILVLNVPFLLNLFQFEKISFTEAFVCAAAGLLSISWFEVYKLFKSRKPIPSVQ